MNSCPRCGHDFRDGARFCTGCGGPTVPPQPAAVSNRRSPQLLHRIIRNRTVGWVAAALAVVVVGVTVLSVLRAVNARPAAPPLAGPTAGPTAGPPADIGATGASQPTRPAPIVDEMDLQRQVEADRAVAEGLVNSWVPQLSSKRLGLTVHSMTIDYPAILADFQALQGRFPRSVLIRSDDYSTYPRPGYWVTVVAETYADADAANAWCDTNGFAAEDCYAHRLSHTDGPAGNSKLRR